MLYESYALQVLATVATVATVLSVEVSFGKYVKIFSNFTILYVCLLENCIVSNHVPNAV